MSDQQDTEDIAHLETVNANLTRSLKRCRVLLDDCRSKLAANANEPEQAQPEDDSERA